MTQFISRAYNTFKIDSKTKAIVEKRSTESRLKDEINYYKNVPPGLSVYFPRLLYSQIEENNYVAGMEYYAYDNLGNLMINNTFDPKIWEKVVDFLFTFINNTKEYKIEETINFKSYYNDCISMYIDKTEKEYNNLINNFNYFKIFDDNDNITLNGKKLKTFNVIWPTIKNYINKNCLVNELNYIHGDFCFSNILYGSNPINKDIVLKFIDPRGSFGHTKYYGDPYYDLAKLMHSCDGGYEYFITDNFKVLDNKTDFTLTFSNNKKTEIKNIFENLIQNYNFNKTKIDILQGSIFVGMCARHYDSFERQKGMLLTGLKILNKVYEELQ